ncbi:hypothetical protein MVEN_01432900 [Mycena venus]|uniref:Uncharacterized protein n=1 Tax=Mycena venus TaxID=2733690 RepID=A0A8H7CUV7_9AGAR|nr:hypothetical protein MVEN_01432900 [Mycena venus]
MPQERLQTWTATAREQIGQYLLRCCGDVDIAGNDQVFLFSIDDHGSPPTRCGLFRSSCAYLYLFSLDTYLLFLCRVAPHPAPLGTPSDPSPIHATYPQFHELTVRAGGWLRRASLCAFATTTSTAFRGVVGTGSAYKGRQR